MTQLTSFFLILVTLLSLSSCEDYKSKFEEERQQQRLYADKIEVLEEEERLIKGEYADAMQTLNAIDETLSEMATRNKEMNALIRQKQLTNDEGEQQAILAKLQALKTANQQANDKVTSLRSKARAFKVENAQLKKTIEQLDARFMAVTDSVNKMQTTIVNMQGALEQLEQEVATTETDLTSTYASLKVRTGKLERANAELETTLVELQNKTDFIAEDAKAYVVCGDRAYLRKSDILRLLSAKRLTADFRKKVNELGTEFDYFNQLEVDCDDKNIQYILPSRASDSYKITGPRLKITNKDAFWATSKTVVLVTD
jgi:chromosome segregation ATPase